MLASAESASAAPEDTSGPGDGTGNRVLLVDDDPAVLESLSMLLEMMEFQVCTATSGREALERGGDFRPNLVLLDIGLPGMDGWTAGRQIREWEWGKEAILVAVTGWGRDQDIRRSHEAGFDHHLVKPMDPDELLAILQSGTSSAPTTNAA